MTRKRYVKLMMACGWDRNAANSIGIDPSECGPHISQERKLAVWAHRGCFPFKTYKEAFENDKILVAMERIEKGLHPLRVYYNGKELK